MLPLEHFEENKEINNRLETINNMIRSAMLSDDNDEQTISFFQDIINDQISRINWKIQSINDHVQHELVNMIYEIDFNKYQKVSQFITHFYNGVPDSD